MEKKARKRSMPKQPQIRGGSLRLGKKNNQKERRAHGTAPIEGVGAKNRPGKTGSKEKEPELFLARHEKKRQPANVRRRSPGRGN